MHILLILAALLFAPATSPPPTAITTVSTIFAQWWSLMLVNALIVFVRTLPPDMGVLDLLPFAPLIPMLLDG